jgi:hypothetical protein
MLDVESKYKARYDGVIFDDKDREIQRKAFLSWEKQADRNRKTASVSKKITRRVKN